MSHNLVDPGGAGRGEVDVEAGAAGDPLTDGRRLVGGKVVADDVDIQFRRDGLVDRLEELQVLGRPVAAVQLADDSAVGDVEGGEQAGGAVPGESWVRRSGMPGIIGSTGWDRSRACTCVFSSTHSTTARSGGLCWPASRPRCAP
jgi:hypothetical protein